MIFGGGTSGRAGAPMSLPLMSAAPSLVPEGLTPSQNANTHSPQSNGGSDHPFAILFMRHNCSFLAPAPLTINPRPGEVMPDDQPVNKASI
jgi:hypothetical protein